METKQNAERKRKAIEELNSRPIKEEMKWLFWMFIAGVFSIIMFLVFSPAIMDWIDSWPWYYQAGMTIVSFLLVFLWIKKQTKWTTAKTVSTGKTIKDYWIIVIQLGFVLTKRLILIYSTVDLLGLLTMKTKETGQELKVTLHMTLKQQQMALK